MNYISQIKYRDCGIDTLNNKSHFHNRELEILHVVNGKGSLMIKDKLYPLKDNTVYFICGKDAHYSSPEANTKYIRNKINFSNDSVTEIAEKLNINDLIEDLFFKGGSAIELSAELSSKTDRCFLNLSNLKKEKENCYILNFYINLFTIFDICLKSKTGALETIENKISNTISYINENINTKLTLDLICEKVNISKYYLCKEFKNTVGMTVFQYIEFLRISKAKDFLSKTDETISNISQKVGFESFAYFSKIFREYEKCTPSNYRKDNKAIIINKSV